MDILRIRKLLQLKESIRLEFKESVSELPRNLFESICAMLNREGGDILLGVRDNGSVVGMDAAKIEKITTDLVNLSNNPQKLDPVFILHPQIYHIEDKIVMHIAVPESSEIHKTGNVIYDRSNDGDFKVTNPALIASLFNRKRSHYSEAVIYPALGIDDFKTELFTRVRNRIRNRYHNHPWLDLTDEQMLYKAGLYSRDTQTGKEGYNLAAVLLFGKDETILNVLPQYKIDALVRRQDMDRYDDRDYININLIEAYDRIMAFVEKHLPDKFYLQGDQRISLRSLVFREVAANLIIHREYTSGYPATFIIYKDRVQIINPNNPHGNGLLLPEQFIPFAKNPIIAKFFIQLGLVDELGSGVLNVYKYLKEYSPGKQPQFIEDKLFKTIIPIVDTVSRDYENVPVVTDDAVNDAVNDAVSIQVRDRLKAELRWIQQHDGVTLKALIETFKIKRATGQRDIKQLKDAGLINFIGSDRSGKYILTAKGKDLFK